MQRMTLMLLIYSVNFY